MSRGVPLLIFCSLLLGCQPKSVQHFEREAVPSTLSQWQLLLTDNGQLLPNDGVVSYELAMPLFSDYAHKFRTLYLPEGTALSFKENGDVRFPLGTIISKTFYYPVGEDGQLLANYQTANHQAGLTLSKHRLIETRLLVLQRDGWQALPYVWNEQQTDATLAWAGDAKPMRLQRQEQALELTYIVPDANQCQSCHTPNHTSKAIEPIGVKARHLNNPLAATGENQLQWLARAGVFEGEISPADWRQNPGWDSDADITSLARSYLDINCGHCHNPSGPADTSGLWLDRDTTDKRRLGLCKPPVAAGRGAGHARFGIMPGEADNSIITYRMASVDPGEMMPELGRASVDEKGLALISQWIDQMTDDCR